MDQRLNSPSAFTAAEASSPDRSSSSPQLGSTVALVPSGIARGHDHHDRQDDTRRGSDSHRPYRPNPTYDHGRHGHNGHNEHVSYHRQTRSIEQLTLDEPQERPRRQVQPSNADSGYPVSGYQWISIEPSQTIAEYDYPVHTWKISEDLYGNDQDSDPNDLLGNVLQGPSPDHELDLGSFPSIPVMPRQRGLAPLRAKRSAQAIEPDTPHFQTHKRQRAVAMNSSSLEQCEALTFHDIFPNDINLGNYEPASDSLAPTISNQFGSVSPPLSSNQQQIIGNTPLVKSQPDHVDGNEPIACPPISPVSDLDEARVMPNYNVDITRSHDFSDQTTPVKRELRPRFSIDEDRRICYYKEVLQLSWREISQLLPRSHKALQVHYSNMLSRSKSPRVEWTHSLDQVLMEVVETHERQMWDVISKRLQQRNNASRKAFAPHLCCERYFQILQSQRKREMGVLAQIVAEKRSKVRS